MREIKVVPYTQDWRRAFEEEKKALLELGISEIAQIHHIGSTSVEGLAAKPIIDILVEVQSLASLDRNQKKIESLGYESKGEFGIEGRRYYRKGRENRTHQIHAFRISDPHVRRHLAFRDYLRENPAVREEYEVLKLKVALECGNDINRYCNGKSDFIKLHEAKALDWMNKLSEQYAALNRMGSRPFCE
jgi:GrpB-like predicted nucleotidyltransferase (UPF0157 family)